MMSMAPRLSFRCVAPNLQCSVALQKVCKLFLPIPLQIGTRRSLHCQVEHHVRTKFATLVLHAMDNFKFYDIFSTYT